MTVVLLKGLCGLAPVVVYLVVLVLLDSYKLVKLRAVVLAILAGAAAVLVCRQLNMVLWNLSGVEMTTFTRYVAPLTEEAAKAAYVAILIRGRRIGFLVDAAILGFAVGAGFGILENIFYLHVIPDARLFTWVLRGCGTAMMHGSTAAIFGIVALRRSEDRHGALPALGLAVLLHSAYNHFFVSPMVTVVGLVVFAPLITYAVFQHSERALERWLGLGFDSDAEMLAIIGAGKLSETRVGAYLVSLRERFPAEVVADMFCLLRLHVELAIHAKGLLLMRKEGFTVAPAPDVREKLAELKYLERSIGQTGRLAVLPFLHRGRKDDWQKHLLEQG
jgi:RsiW-degrading membrane proteinase PrsW (M82 family)